MIFDLKLYLKLLACVVSGVSFITWGVLECNIAYHQYVAVCTTLCNIYRKPSTNVTLIRATSIIAFQLFVNMAKLALGQTSIIVLQ